MARKRINLALQGGGAHGAFTWGVLTRLLQDDDIEIGGISGTSAGALNAVAIKSGMIAGGREGALANLDWLWAQVGAITDERFVHWISSLTPAAGLMATAMEYSPAYQAFDATTRFFSPYTYGPMLQNPLRRIVERFDYTHLAGQAGPDIYICATNVRSGKIRVFSAEEIGADAVLASACLPTLFQAVEMFDARTGKVEAYWDGGYTGNPALFPLFAGHLPDDILIVNINPLYREELPDDSRSIANRINEISFNSSLLRELRAIEFVKRLIGQGKIAPGAMKDVRVHMVSDDALMNELNVATKTIPSPVVLARLKDAGEIAADTFLAAHRDDLNHRDTVDLRAMFM